MLSAALHQWCALYQYVSLCVSTCQPCLKAIVTLSPLHHCWAGVSFHCSFSFFFFEMNDSRNILTKVPSAQDVPKCSTDCFSGLRFQTSNVLFRKSGMGYLMHECHWKMCWDCLMLWNRHRLRSLWNISSTLLSRCFPVIQTVLDPEMIPTEPSTGQFVGNIKQNGYGVCGLLLCRKL